MTSEISGPGRVILPHVGGLDARVDLQPGGHATALLLGHPSRSLENAVGDRVTLDIPTPRGLLHCDAHVVDVPSHELVELDLDGEPELIQRRDNLRVEAFVPVFIESLVPGGPSFDTRTLDIGGGGALVAHLGTLEVGEPVEVTLLYADDAAPVSARATVVRDAGENRRGVRFDAISARERDRLVKHVFERERRARQLLGGESQSDSLGSS